MGQIRRRVVQTEALEARLAQHARQLREQANAMPAGIEKAALLKRARQADTGAHLSEWLLSAALQPPT
nr:MULTISPECIES: hypothetical protein [unclassified Bradyrhizobium]